MSNIRIVSDDEEFGVFLGQAGDDLVIVDFFTTWCRPCKTMEPVFESMALHYPKALFLKVDADRCFNTAMNYKVSGVPFFVIIFNKTVVDTIQGANTKELELKIRMAEIESRKASTALEQANNMNSKLASHVNPVISTFGKLGSVTPYVDPDNSHCLNDLSPTSFHNFIGGKKLISGRGTGKILLVYSFTQKMMLQSFKIKANQNTGPKVMRFFVNHPKVLDFSVGSTLAPSQEVTLSAHDLTGERAIELRSGSFQVVTNVQIFIVSGQSKNSRIEIDSFQLFGAPVLAVQPLSAPESSAKPVNNNNGPSTSSTVNSPASSEQTKGKPKCDTDTCNVPGMIAQIQGDDDDDDDTASSPSASSKHFGYQMSGSSAVPAYHHGGHHHHHKHHSHHHGHNHHHHHHHSKTENTDLAADSKNKADEAEDKPEQSDKEKKEGHKDHHHHHHHHH